MFAPPAVYSDDSWEGGGPERLSHHDFDLRKEESVLLCSRALGLDLGPKAGLGTMAEIPTL